ncbi:MAG: hypothetical protein KF752_04915 [Pirellulaceae bacterium]|nr:hypothetical protein [Pirellulaceae bacterium]
MNQPRRLWIGAYGIGLMSIILSNAWAQEELVLELEDSGTVVKTEAAVVKGEVIQQRYPSGQLHITRQVILDSNGNFVNHGEYQEWSQRGDVIVSGTYKMGRADGVWIRFCTAGSSKLFEKEPYTKFKSPFQSSVEFSDGKMNGMWTISDAENRTISQIQLLDGLRDGPAIWYYPGGHEFVLSHYQQGLPHGDLVQKDAKGNIIKQLRYTAGQRVERKQEFFADKKPRIEYEYLTAAQKLTAPDNWHENTLASYEVQNVEIRHGDYTAYFENGAVRYQASYQHGQLHGKFASWYANGQPESTGQYAAGQQVGKWNWWHDNGMRKAIAEYHQGQLSSGVLAWNDQGIKQSSNSALQEMTLPSAQSETRLADQRQSASKKVPARPASAILPRTSNSYRP